MQLLVLFEFTSFIEDAMRRAHRRPPNSGSAIRGGWRGSSISKSPCGVSLSVSCGVAGSWRVLGGSWLLLAVLGPLLVKNGSQQSIKRRLGGQEWVRTKALKVNEISSHILMRIVQQNYQK